MSLHVEVKIDVVLHATENQEKFFDSFLENFDIKQENFYIQNLTGHFDNPIILASTNLKKEGAKAFVIKFFNIINTTDFDKIYKNIEESISNSGLKLKISKQEMISGSVVLEDKDAVKITMTCPVYVKKDSKKIYQQLLQLGK
tara:strand:- start:61 stop:489 length:429 start_codon:yes stop_codon:yes gene_type:complete